MKLRRAAALAAATAVISPAVLLVAPAAHATTSAPSVSSSPAPDASPSAPSTAPDGAEESGAPEQGTVPGQETGNTEPGGGESGEAGENTGGTDEKKNEPGTGEADGKTSPAAPKSPAAPSSETPDPQEENPQEEENGEDGYVYFCEEPQAEVTITGLSGRIAAGSGWHEFSMNVRNTSDVVLTDLDYFAAASSDAEGDNLFTTKQVRLQTLDPETETWQDLSDEDGEAVGYVGWSDSLEPGHQVQLPMRIDVRAGAPVGAGFSLGASTYADMEGDCTGVAEVAYRFEIVKGGTDTGGTEPQEGGKVPLPTEKPKTEPGTEVKTSTQLTGNLAETGSSSALPTVGIVGGIAIVAGAGVVFALKRRRSDAAA
jgi:LPXTG-motif cell wall-anchored protein